jgi:hypothetical protein
MVFKRSTTQKSRRMQILLGFAVHCGLLRITSQGIHRPVFEAFASKLSTTDSLSLKSLKMDRTEFTRLMRYNLRKSTSDPNHKIFILGTT